MVRVVGVPRWLYQVGYDVSGQEGLSVSCAAMIVQAWLEASWKKTYSTWGAVSGKQCKYLRSNASIWECKTWNDSLERRL